MTGCGAFPRLWAGSTFDVSVDSPAGFPPAFVGVGALGGIFLDIPEDLLTSFGTSIHGNFIGPATRGSTTDQHHQMD